MFLCWDEQIYFHTGEGYRWTNVDTFMLNHHSQTTQDICHWPVNTEAGADASE